MNLILLEPRDVDAAGRALLTGRAAEHVRRVLRCRPGDQIRIGLLEGPKGIGEVTAVAADRIELLCRFEPVAPPRPNVDLLLAMPRPKAMKRLWPQVAALGVDCIWITGAVRVEPSYFTSHVLNEGFFRGLLMEGLQQARDTRLPRVVIQRRLYEAVDAAVAASPDALRIALDPTGDQPLTVRLNDVGGRRGLLAIGPEGGWIPQERELLIRHGFSLATLGPRTLRADTACIVALAIWHACAGHARSVDA